MAGLRDVGDFIREQRRSAQISLRQLAKQTGVSNPYLSQIERGLRKPSAEVLQQIANALRVSTPAMYLRAGLLEHGEGQGVLTAIAADEVLTTRQKQSLAEIYEAFRRENLRSAHADADATSVGGSEPHDPGVGAAAGAGTTPAPAAEAAPQPPGVPDPAGSTDPVGTADPAGSSDAGPAGDPPGAARSTAVPMARTAASAARRAASKAAQRAADGAARAAGSPAAKAAQRSAGRAAQRAADTAAAQAVRSAVGKRGRGRPSDQ
nr:helix-turn-helix domain-containing protein [Actinocatenispora thailandica]